MTEINDKHELYSVYTSSCTTCKNKFDVIGFTCLAFPKGIPDSILGGKDKHNVPITNQGNAIVYAAK